VGPSSLSGSRVFRPPRGGKPLCEIPAGESTFFAPFPSNFWRPPRGEKPQGRCPHPERCSPPGRFSARAIAAQKIPNIFPPGGCPQDVYPPPWPKNFVPSPKVPYPALSYGAKEIFPRTGTRGGTNLYIPEPRGYQIPGRLDLQFRLHRGIKKASGGKDYLPWYHPGTQSICVLKDRSGDTENYRSSGR